MKELAEAPVRESTKQDVSGVLHVGFGMRGGLCSGIRLSTPVEVGLFTGALPARVSRRRPRLRSLQPPRLHSHDYRGNTFRCKWIISFLRVPADLLECSRSFVTSNLC